MARCDDDSCRTTVEVEGRLGIFTDKGFNSNVGKQNFCTILAMLETYPQWHHVTNWVETQDVFYVIEIPSNVSGLDKPTRCQVRTSVGVDASKTMTICHTMKRKLKSVSMHVVPLGGCGSNSLSGTGDPLATPLDARVTVSVEHALPPEMLPVAVVSDLVRIKQRKRFTLSSLGVDNPAFAIDLTIVYSGKTKSEAERRQAAEQDAHYEVEVECLDPVAYLQTCNQEEPVLALSILLKLHDFAAALNPSTQVTFARDQRGR